MPKEAMEPAALVRGLQEAANSRDFLRLGEFYAEDAVAVSPVFGEVRGRAEIVRTFEKTFEMVPDFSFDVSEVFKDGDRLALLGTVTATDRNGWFGLPSSGARFRYRLTIVCTVIGDKIVHEERLYDLTGVVERLEKARLDTELKIASDVQSALLPRISVASARWEAAADSIPCRAIGGDFFEITELSSGGLAVALGDVEGKGTPAALVGAMLHGMFASDTWTGLGPAATLSRMNRQLVASRSGNNEIAVRQKGSRFVSLVYGVLSPDGRFVYSNAGHVRPALLSAGGDLVRLTTGGPILGAFPSPSFEEAEVRLSAGNTLLLFSDGVTEARNAQDEEFEEERLLACAVENRACSPAEMLDRILGAVRDFCGPTPQTDDITVTVTRLR